VTPSELPAHWRGKAEDLRPFAPAAAEAFAHAAQELEESLREQDEEVLTLEDAAAESGYSPDHLGTLIRQGKVANVGRKHAPGIRRRDLPRKPGASERKPTLVRGRTGGATLGRITRDALSSRTPGR
jgi:hypothetical protein